MTQPAVNISELDGALGILPPASGKLLACVGVSSSGPLDTPATFARVKDITAIYGQGPMVEAAAVQIEKYGRPVVIVRTGETNVGTFPADAATVFAGTGTSVITVDDAGTAPHDDYEFAFRVVTGGTIGVAGITFQWSLDGGRTYSPITALGVATSFTFPDSGGASIDFAAGTLVAGDLATFRGTAPLWNSTEIGTALDALFASSVNWGIAHIVGPIDATSFDVIDPKFSAALVAGKERSWIGSVRMPDLGESEATYLAAMDALLSAKATSFGSIAAGAGKATSSVSGRKYRRPVSFCYASLEASSSDEVNVADVNRGPIPGWSIRDANGNPDEHDESLNPGLDDLRFVTLRTWEGIQGVYINRPLMFSAAGSDFDIHPKRLVINVAHAVLRPYLVRRLNKPIRVNKTTGFILEGEALEIEAGARAVMRAALLAKPKASAVQFVLSRTDNLLSTKTLTGQARVTPLGYAETIDLDLGFLNPALQVQSV